MITTISTHLWIDAVYTINTYENKPPLQITAFFFFLSSLVSWIWCLFVFSKISSKWENINDIRVRWISNLLSNESLVEFHSRWLQWRLYNVDKVQLKTWVALFIKSCLCTYIIYMYNVCITLAISYNKINWDLWDLIIRIFNRRLNEHSETP